ncbi:MAG: hypothetical protein HZA46_19265 [Planctomycetales bacterium]|nr:hypothetical protein [Planctomycetales bacterium]
MPFDPRRTAKSGHPTALFGKALSQADVLQCLADDETINDLVRHRASELARDGK